MKQKYYFHCMIILFTGIIFTCLFTAGLHAQTSIFERVSLEQGLSQSSVNSILQDDRGYMWFATQEGLNKYDGYNFTIFTYDPANKNSLSMNFIIALIKDSKGDLWIGTDGGGLNKFNPVTEQWIRFRNEPGNNNSLSNNYIQAIYEDREGALWVGTNGGGLERFEEAKSEWTHYQNEPGNANSLSDNHIRAIYEDKDGIYWIGTSGGGLNRFDRRKGAWRHYRNKPGDPNSLSSDFITTGYIDQSGIFWIGTAGNGLNRFDPEKDEWTVYRNDPDNPDTLSSDFISALYKDKEGIFWVGTLGGGANKFNPESGEWKHYLSNANDLNSLSNNNVLSFFEDNAGVFWIGTNGGGLSKLEKARVRWVHYNHRAGESNSLNNNDVRAIYEDASGIMWIGTNGGGVDRFDRVTGKWIHYINDTGNSNSLSNNNIRSICEDKDGMFWIGTWGSGVDKYDRKEKKWINYSTDPDNENSISHNLIRFIYEDRDGLLWIGTWGGGLNAFDRETGTWTHYYNDPDNPNSVSTDFIFSILEDEEGLLWIGTWGSGLNKYDKKLRKWTHYNVEANNSNSLNNSGIASLYKDNNGILWIGTWGGGLNKYDIAADKWTHYTTENGLPNNVVYGILNDNRGNIWLSTNRGLSKFNPQEETFKNYDVNDGLQGNEFNSGAFLKSKNGSELFFGGLNGFNAFYPDTIKDNLHIPPIIITSFKKYDKEVKYDRPLSDIESIRLSYKTQVFSFSFVALDYANPMKNQYAYKLEGFDKEWVYSGNRRFAPYMNLDGGNYVFRVKGSNNSGIWNEEGASINIKVDPPPWKTWWAYSLYIVIGVASASGYARIKSREHARQLEAKVKELEREKLVAMQEKKLLAIHHELETARKIQSFILPQTMPDIKNLNIAARYIPMEAVAGDFYEFLVVDDSHLGVLVADVSGHGVPAALISSMVKVAIAAQAHQAADPASVLIAMNAIFYGKVHEQFITAAYLYIDAEKRMLRYCGAGHPPLLVWRKPQQRMYELMQNGLILGPFPSSRYSNVELEIEKGDRIFVYTDGIIEVTNGSEEMFGKDRFREFIKDNDRLSADRFADTFVQHLTEWSGKASGIALNDDLTLIIIDVF
ncbi:MAG: hypothetical protein A2Y62_06155 [Candidatus Fischerbacteria bacterium RBG_13_37_8]|uniref:PPM-type phosphatase domain-containing protein n=1 Tax=Candidatus Fischerbacteria bacterium RBG_13_37_8 TaxID=1817863 RepID=A0A1F5VW49_9BACT|nr:MAG: hypothetical protein A2Y62_06155 [Candidatus Fischerbacteria bacterium RBG_13_37_8]